MIKRSGEAAACSAITAIVINPRTITTKPPNLMASWIGAGNPLNHSINPLIPSATLPIIGANSSPNTLTRALIRRFKISNCARNRGEASINFSNATPATTPKRWNPLVRASSRGFIFVCRSLNLRCILSSFLSVSDTPGAVIRNNNPSVTIVIVSLIFSLGLAHLLFLSFCYNFINCL